MEYEGWGSDAWNYELLPPLLNGRAGAMEIQETLRCRGHPNITARHPTTLEVTREDHLSSRGDCIVGIGSDKGAAGLSPLFVKALARDDALLVSRFSCQGTVMEIISRGSSAMTFTHPADLVWRKSMFVCGRTVGIRSDSAAGDFPRDLVRLLCDGGDLLVEMTVVVED